MIPLKNDPDFLNKNAYPLQNKYNTKNMIQLINVNVSLEDLYFGKTITNEVKNHSFQLDLSKLDLMTTVNTYKNRIRFNDQLLKVAIPTLCLVGDYTKLGKEMMERVSSCIQNSELKVIGNSFDPSNLCQPKVFNKTVHKFISNLL